MQILQQKLIPVTSDFLSPTTFFVWQKQGRWWQDLLYEHKKELQTTIPEALYTRKLLSQHLLCSGYEVEGSNKLITAK